MQITIVLWCALGMAFGVWAHCDSQWDPRWGLFDGACWTSSVLIGLRALELRRRRLITAHMRRMGAFIGMALIARVLRSGTRS
jgi:hypothetical protein